MGDIIKLQDYLMASIREVDVRLSNAEAGEIASIRVADQEAQRQVQAWLGSKIITRGNGAPYGIEWEVAAQKNDNALIIRAIETATGRPVEANTDDVNHLLDVMLPNVKPELIRR